MLGWTVLNHLKQDPATRHIPVQMLTLDEDRHHGLARGAFAFVTKPTTPEGLESALARIKEYSAPRRKRLLVVEDNPAEQLRIKELLGYDDIDVSVVATGAKPSRLSVSIFDCVVLDLRCPIYRASTCWRDSVILRHWATCPSWSLPEGTFAGRRCAAAFAGSQRSGKGSGIARKAAGRDGAFPASRGRRSSGKSGC